MGTSVTPHVRPDMAQDQYDWYKVYVQNGEMLHAALYNNGTPADVYIDMTIFDSSSTSLTTTRAC